MAQSQLKIHFLHPGKILTKSVNSHIILTIDSITE